MKSLVGILGVAIAACGGSGAEPKGPLAVQQGLGQRCTDGVVDGHEVTLCLDDVSWPEARRRCSQADMQLLVIRNPTAQREADDLLMKSGAAPTDAPWIGMRKGAGGALIWVDGSGTAFQAFTEGEPNGGGAEACIHMNWPLGGGTWNDARCDDVQAWSSFICEKSVLRLDVVPEG
ncbi:MAG TPA: C-type lectin domain-containing protein [Kofleriaceae bacterium]|nr:C-type lectin domain-containing protein [Kofleriaceae bacterium]